MKWFVLIACLVLLVVANAIYLNGSLYSFEQEKGKVALLSVLGIGELSLSSECVSIMEGITSCLGEIPGGYCYHSDCDIIGAPDVGVDNRFIMEIRKHAVSK